MDKCKEMSQNNGRSNASRPHIAEESIQKDLPCNVDTKLPESDNCLDKENTSIKHEEISDLKELFQKNCVKGDEPPRVLGENNNQNYEILTETEDVTDKEDVRIIKEKLKVLELTTDLQHVIIYLFQQTLKLLDIKNRKFKNDLINSVEVLQKALDETLWNFLKQSGAQDSKLQNILNIVESTNIEVEKDFVDNMEQILEETRSKFLKFQETYKICKTYLETFLPKAEDIQTIRNIPNNSEMKRRSLFLIPKDSALKLNNSRLVSVETAFGEFETILKNYPKISAENTDNVDLLITAFAKANLAYRELYLLTVAVLNMDFAEV